MIPLPFLAGKTVAVIGLGRSGAAAARALSASGATVWAWDDDASKRAEAAGRGLEIVDPAAGNLSRVDLLLWSPGIPHTFPAPNPVALRARAAGLAPVCEVELLLRARADAAFLAVTGTNGKSTTTALLGHIMAAARPTGTGGNLGTPALELDPLGADGAYVLELSSYQLELVETAALDVAVLLNISPDHLGRHGGMDGYVAAKERIFAILKAGGTAVIGVDDEFCRSIRRRLDRPAIPVSVASPVLGGVYAPKGILVDDRERAARRVIDLRQVATLPGRHNWQNACAAYAAARAAGVTEEQAVAAILSYPGLPHRQEHVGTVDGIAFVNDSKATNADAAEKALVCYDAVYWIAGGIAKEGGIESLRPLFGRIAHAFLIGEAAEEFAATLDGAVPHTVCGDLTTAVAVAHAKAAEERRPGAVVLLSPAGASWDQFTGFEQRGDAFRELVAALPGGRAAG